jgi:molecular chaperone GrpE
MEALRAQLTEKHDQLLRLAAEFDNYKKRTDRHFRELTASANAGLIGELLPVLDNFDRALEKGSGADSEAVHEGVAMIRRQLEEVLAKAGLVPIEAVGHKFDPHVHEALMQTDSDSAAPETIVSEVEVGYTLQGKVLRPAKVIVSK